MQNKSGLRMFLGIRLVILAIMSSAITAFISASAWGQNEAPSKLLRIAVTLPNYLAKFDPNRSFLSTYDIVMNPLFDKLLTFDQQGQRKMLVAKSVAFSQDGMAIKVTLNDDSFWSFGERVVAEDFARGLRRAAMEHSDTLHLMTGIRNSGKWAAGDYSSPLGIEATDDFTLMIYLERAFRYDVSNLMNMHANPYPPPGRHSEPYLATNGPYMIQSVDSAEISLTRNPYYRGALPYFDKISYVGFSHSLAIDYFLSGKADLLLGPLGKQKKWLLDRYKSGVIEFGLPRQYIIVLAAPNANTPAVLKNAEFRRALYTSLDRETFEKSGFFFSSQRRCGFIPAAIPCSEERKRIWTVSDTMKERIQKAKDVVRSAGYSTENPLRLTLVVATSIHGYTEIAGFIKSSWHEIGVEVDIVAVAAYGEASAAMKSGKYNMVVNSFYQLEPHQYVYFPGSFTDWVFSYGPRNEFVDELALRASRSEGAEYAELILAAERDMMDTMTVIPIASDSQVGLYAEWIETNQENAAKLNVRYVTAKNVKPARDCAGQGLSTC